MKPSESIDYISNQITDKAFSGCSIERVRIGRVSMDGIAIANREGAINFIDAMHTVMERTRRRRAGSHAEFPANLPGAAPTRLLSVEIALYIKALEQRKLSYSFIGNNKHALRLLLAVCDDIPVSKINDQHISDFWDGMRWWPSQALKRNELNGLSDRQIIQTGKDTNVPAPSDVTMNQRLGMVRTFFERLVKMRILANSPCDGFIGIDTSTQVKVRRPFTDAEIAAMFDHENFLPWAKKYPHLWWMPMIGLYSGARVSEIAQLKVNDIECVDGVWCFHFRKTMDRDLIESPGNKTRQVIKNQASIRTVPIAQALLNAGLVRFLDDIKQVNHPRLFPHLSTSVSGTGYASTFKTQYSPYLKRFVAERQIGFHSFRHYFSTALKNAGVPLEVIARLTGHTLAARVPTLQGFYLPIHGVVTQQDMIRAIESLNPPVALPQYTNGQFARRLGKAAKLYP